MSLFIVLHVGTNKVKWYTELQFWSLPYVNEGTTFIFPVDFREGVSNLFFHSKMAGITLNSYYVFQIHKKKLLYTKFQVTFSHF